MTCSHPRELCSFLAQPLRLTLGGRRTWSPKPSQCALCPTLL